MRYEKEKQAPWQSARCLEACFALIIAHYGLKMLKTHFCLGRQKCVTAWKRTMKMKARAAFLGSALKIWADHKKVGQTVSKLGSPLAQWVQAFQRP